MRRLAAAVLVLTVASVSAAAWDGGARANARAAPAPVTRTHFTSLPAMASALRAAIASLASHNAQHRRVIAAPRAVPLLPGSGTCYVAAGTCSERPCVEYTVLRSATVYIPFASPGRRTKCIRAARMARVSVATPTVTVAPTLPVRSP